MKPAATALLFAALSLVATAATPPPAPSPTPAPAVSPTPTPTPTPPPTLTLSDGKAYTAAEIEKGFKDLQDRVNELVQERNTFAGQAIDLNALLQKHQQPSAPVPPPTPPPAK